MVNINIINGPNFRVAWKSGLNIQTALEAAHTNAPSATFSFALQYYGAGLGYLVSMINETYESFNAKETPFYFWEIQVNGAISPTGIDNTLLNDNDSVTLEFTAYTATTSKTSTLQAKFQQRNGAK